MPALTSTFGVFFKSMTPPGRKRNPAWPRGLAAGIALVAAACAPPVIAEEDRAAQSEAKAIVERAYVDELGRYPDEGGLRVHLRFLLEDGKDEAWLRAALRGSPEGRRVAAVRGRQRAILIGLAAAGLGLVGLARLRSRSTKEFGFRMAAIAGSAVVTCAAVEIGLRIHAAVGDRRQAEAWTRLGTAAERPRPGSHVLLPQLIRLSAHPDLVYELQPDLDVRFMGGRVRTTSTGHRVVPGASADPDAFTVVGLGDSVMFGWGVDDEAPYLARLAARWNERFPRNPLRTVNLAVPGYNTYLEVQAFRLHGPSHRPDLVLLHYVDNDLLLPSFIRAPDTRVRLTGSHLLAALSARGGGRLRTRPFDRLDRAPREPPPEFAHMAGEAAFEASVRELAALCRGHGARLALICNWTAPPIVQATARDLDIPLLDLGPTLVRYCRDHGIKDYQGSVLTVSARDPHFSALGHELVTEALLGFLLEHGLLPAPASS